MSFDSWNLAVKTVKDKKPIKGGIKNDKKINKDIISNIKPEIPGGKKRGRPKKDENTKKVKLNLHIDPRYLKILKAEAESENYDLGPYIISEYISKPLKEKYKDLK